MGFITMLNMKARSNKRYTCPKLDVRGFILNMSLKCNRLLCSAVLRRRLEGKSSRSLPTECLEIRALEQNAVSQSTCALATADLRYRRVESIADTCN